MVIAPIFTSSGAVELLQRCGLLPLEVLEYTLSERAKLFSLILEASTYPTSSRLPRGVANTFVRLVFSDRPLCRIACRKGLVLRRSIRVDCGKNVDFDSRRGPLGIVSSTPSAFEFIAVPSGFGERSVSSTVSRSKEPPGETEVEG